MLEKKNILVGVSGGIAAYKACDLVRKLVLAGADVHVVMTKNAQQFVTPLTFQTLSNNKVSTELFDLQREAEIGHIALADNADLIVAAPATATLIGKAASGIADNLLNAIILATKSPVIFCPAMNVNMYNNSVVQDNITKLKDHGYNVLEPSEGSLACGWEGKGRLPDTHIILQEMERVLSPKDLAGEKVLVTAGPTREYLDPVRFISNPSSGKMGFALAKDAWKRGAEVILVSGITDTDLPYGVNTIVVQSAEQMYEAVVKLSDWASVVVKAAAVGDYSAKNYEKDKISKRSGSYNLELQKTKDILFELGKNKNGKLLVGFAAETNDIVKKAKNKLKEKNLDMIVVNDVTKEDSGFSVDTNSAVILNRLGGVNKYGVMPKELLASKIFDEVLGFKSSVSG
ncbi:MAG: bifunctional phosphopantothenoylcysteine decarboxylase/phosphopantothenate--cysteine ligase CoaBC [Candidatus Dadabacteria bacterium]|nr:bifunctional phosphopantothenoylcysteine decarboxylase/phosphopantothenate--cysteine ligase CoaBC [Candidatus Dadabacteria bacterium]NIS07706.1 bifunctional phosphopantothenoylcysteine decarboxylase/phosphopantothenate--cysteine ligase CoaBC [Candidatus Dadabacteria bacterium]NIV42285.1 bifunctional phosphopantothenoylcysteine decarboxylase/phosphopantothenate--cysteine ligase CoaBC [Candidatus Dadabacteria bacterium]NIX14792.1 bifunctional phosphopantothenoylcysteine decarboxylase/phosphopan